MTDQSPFEPIELPASRLAVDTRSEGRPGGSGLPPNRRRGRNVLLAAAVVATLVVLVLGPLRTKVRDALGGHPTTTTVPVPVDVAIPPGFRLANIINRYHSMVPSLSVTAMRRALTDGSVTSTLLPPGGVPASRLPENGSALEGLLLPSTWSVPRGASADLVLENMVSGMEDETAQLGISAAAQRLNLTPYQIITVASMVQAEAGNPDEAPKIARVIYNRLAADEPLGIDATSKYLKCVTSLNEQVCQSPLTNADFKVDSPYNTRTHRGLPPTPIGAPGKDALEAAMNPAAGPWRFYVRAVADDSLGRPQHEFFADNTSADYNRAVQACMASSLGC